jgi:hypothetical protein
VFCVSFGGFPGPLDRAKALVIVRRYLLHGQSVLARSSYEEADQVGVRWGRTDDCSLCSWHIFLECLHPRFYSQAGTSRRSVEEA